MNEADGTARGGLRERERAREEEKVCLREGTICVVIQTD